MNPTILLSATKNFFILLCCIYAYTNILNIRFTYKTHFFALLFSLFSTPAVCFIQTTIPLYTVLVITILVSLFCHLLFKQDIPQIICISTLSIGISYALFALSVIITAPFTYLLFINKVPKLVITSLIFPLVGILQNLIINWIFRTKRLRNGIPGITKAFLGDTGVFIGGLLILFTSAFFITKDTLYLVFHLLIIAFIISLGIIIWLWWHKTIQTDYICKTHVQQIGILENKLQERDAELERLSKIIHKDNKLLAALELSTRELLADASNEKAAALLQELNRFSKERSETLQSYESRQVTLPKTGLFSVDTMLNYLHQRAMKHKIDFQLSLDAEISSITDVISEQDLCTIIADLGENAIIATKGIEAKNIRLSIERKTDGYALYFFDSGEPFAAEVLENFGKQRCTTHAETGGSGIGLVTTGELAAKYQGEFYITEENIPQPYTKCVVVTLKERR